MHRLQQRCQHKRPEVQAGVRQQQAGVVQAKFTPEQQIQIEAARAPALFTRTITAKCRLKRLQQIEELQRSGIRDRA